MIGAVRRMLASLRGSDPATVPPMDGVLGPNRAIEEATALLDIAAPDNLVVLGDRILFSSGPEIFEFKSDGESGVAKPFRGFDHDISALAASSDGGIAVGLGRGCVVIVGGCHDGRELREIGGRPIICATALAFADADTLIVALGSQQHGPEGWRRDLMERNASGSVWRVNLASGQADCLGDRLCWPAGLLAGAGGGVIVAESWRNRLIELRPGASPRVVLGDIAGYPGRLAPASDGGAWLAVFAPRSQLVEFVLREDDYRRSMLTEVEEEYWIAPSLLPARSFLEPMQLGGLKQHGMLKPWAPSRSCGLVIGLDSEGEPRTSFHSRADGRRHGVTSAIEAGGRLVVTAKGGDCIVAITPGLAQGGAA